MVSHSRHVTGNRVVRMNLANLPGEDDETGEMLSSGERKPTGDETPVSADPIEVF